LTTVVVRNTSIDKQLEVRQANSQITTTFVESYESVEAGPDLTGGANWAVAQGPPQLRGLHKKTVKKLLPKETKNTNKFINSFFVFRFINFTKYKSKYRYT